tara:strand:- start:1099 stop:1905 length:807 start_codon:yes stop_codon:yes gene_type:complete
MYNLINNINIFSFKIQKISKIFHTYLFNIGCFFFPSIFKQIKFISKEEIYINKQFEQLNKFISSKSDIINTNIDKQIYNNIENPESELINKWKSNIIFESTPHAYIIMYYDLQKRAFIYYTNDSIPYNILNSVAAKYVTQFYCVDFFVDSKINYTSQLQKIIEEKEEKEEEKHDKHKQKSNFINSGPFLKKKHKGTQEKIETEKIELIFNKFISNGKTYDFSILQKTNKQNSILNNFKSVFIDNFDQEHQLQNNVLSYKEFKLKQSHN